MIHLTELNRTESRVDGVLIRGEGSSVAVFIYGINLHYCAVDLAARVNDSAVNDNDRCNRTVVKNLGNSDCNVGGLGNLSVGEAYCNRGVANGKHLFVNNVLVVCENLSRAVVVKRGNCHTGSIKGRACLVFDCVGIYRDVNCLEHNGLKGDGYDGVLTLVSNGNLTALCIEIDGSLDGEIILLNGLAPGLLALFGVICVNDKMLGANLCHIVCKEDNSFFKLGCNRFKNRLDSLLLISFVLFLYLSEIVFIFVVRLQGNCDYDAGRYYKAEKQRNYLYNPSSHKCCFPPLLFSTIN